MPLPTWTRHPFKQGLLEEKSANMSSPRDHETTKRYDESDDDVNSLVLERTFGVNNCFGCELEGY